MTTTARRALADARPTSYWLDRTELPLPDLRGGRAGATAREAVDLVVVGGGLTGLWAAYEAARLGRSVILVEQGRLGAGASGRCGGFINASVTHGIPNGHHRWPDEMDDIVALQNRLWDDTLQLLERAGHGDIIEPTGKVSAATTPVQLAAIRGAVEIFRRYGSEVRELDRDELAEVVRSPMYLGGYELRSSNGVCDPARLLWALADLAEGAGAQLFEEIGVDDLRADDTGVSVELGDGQTIRARTVFLATNASPPLLKRLRAWVIPVYDHVIVTEPLSASQWCSIGWNQRQGVTDGGNQFHYYRPTPDGGILFGGWDATYHFGGRVDPSFERSPATHEMLVRHLTDRFPVLEGIKVTHAWGGPIDSTSRFTPTIGTAANGKIAWAMGYTGLGVGASRFGALASLDLLIGRATDRTRLTMVRRQPIPFPPEPLRWPAIAITKRALLREDRTGRKGPWLRLLDRFGVGFDT